MPSLPKPASACLLPRACFALSRFLNQPSPQSPSAFSEVLYPSSTSIHTIFAACRTRLRLALTRTIHPPGGRPVFIKNHTISRKSTASSQSCMVISQTTSTFAACRKRLRLALMRLEVPSPSSRLGSCIRPHRKRYGLHRHSVSCASGPVSVRIVNGMVCIGTPYHAPRVLYRSAS